MKLIFTWLLFCFIQPIFAKPKEVKIGFVTDGDKSANLQNSDHFTRVLQNTMRESNTVDGDDNGESVELIFSKKYNVVGDHTMEGIAEALDVALKNREIDIVIMTGPIGAKVASDRGKSRSGLNKPVVAPIVFDADLQGIGTDINTNRSNVQNFNFLSIPHVIENDLRAFTNVVGFYHVGVVVDETLLPTFEVDARDYINERSSMIRKVTLLPVRESGDKLLAEYGSRSVDFQGVYVTTLTHMSEENEAILLQGLKKAKLPTFSMDGPSDVNRGALASLTPRNIRQLIDSMLATNIQRIIKGEKAQDLPVLLNIEGSLNINLETAEFLSVWPEWDVLAEAEIIGGKEVKALNLTDVIQLSKMNNPKMGVEQHNSTIKAQEFLRLRSAYLPQLEANITGQFIDHDQRVQPLQLDQRNDVWTGVRLDQKIWSYETLAKMKLNQTEQAVETLDMMLLQQQITEDAVLAFLKLVEYQSIVEQYQQHFSLVRSQLDMARRTDLHGDVARMEAVFAKTKEEMLQAKANAMEMEVLLHQILSTDLAIGNPAQQLMPEEEMFLSYLRDPRTFSEVHVVLSELSVRKSNVIERGYLEEVAINDQLKAGKYAYWNPEVGMYAGVRQHLYRPRGSYYEDIAAYNSLVDVLAADEDLALSYDLYDITVPRERNDTDWYVGMYVDLPLFTGMDRRAKVDQLKAELQQQEERNAYDKESLSFELHKRLVRVNSLYRSMQISDQMVKEADRALQAVSVQYFAGEVLLSELRDSSDIALRASIRQQMLIGAFRRELFQLMSLVGLQDFYIKQDARDILFLALEQHFLSKGFPLPQQ